MVKPIHHWQFTEREGSTTTDLITGVDSQINKSDWEGHGRIGPALKLHGSGSRVDLGNEVGQFGTGDFTIAFGVISYWAHRSNDLDIIGSRAMRGHGNFFSVRLINVTHLAVEVDQDEQGTHYIRLDTPSLLTEQKWGHVAIVRQGPTLKVYFDGALVAEKTSTTGVANISNSHDFRLGDWTRNTPIAKYEDLRIYDTALNDFQIQNLQPLVNRVLREGEVELVATDNTTVTLTEDVANIETFSTLFQKLRLGPDTGVTLYSKPDFSGSAQKLYSNVSNIPATKVGSHPRSMRVWSPKGEPFTGKWIITAPNGEYLSWNGDALTTSPTITSKEHFTLQHNFYHDQPQFFPIADTEGKLFPTTLLADYSEQGSSTFSFVNLAHDQWLAMNPDKTFSWTQSEQDRAIFEHTLKIADNEGQVGELATGEVALYQHSLYKGRAFILSNSTLHDNKVNADLRIVPGLNDIASSVRLGADTGVTLFKNPLSTTNNTNQIEDVLEDVENFETTQIGHDVLSAVQIFKTVPPEAIFESYTSILSEDYRLVDGELEQFSAYRTTLRFAPDITEVEISATDATTIEVDGVVYEIDEDTPTLFSPNAMKRLVITTEAEGLSTAGLKFRTSTMGENERVVIFPDRQAHQQIAELEPDALWNATDANGNPIVDQTQFSQSEVASLQNTISRVMATVVSADDTSATTLNTDDVVDVDNLDSVISAKRASSTETIDNAWSLNFNPAHSTRERRDGTTTVSALWEEPVDQSEFEQQLGFAHSSFSVVGNTRSLTSFGSSLKDTFKDAVSVTVGAFDGLVNIVVDLGKSFVSFVLDTAQKVAEFVEALVEKVVESVKAFIEFLRFLFAWKDILETKRYLVRAINSAMDTASDLALAAKNSVSEFFDGLQEGLDDGIDNIVQLVGGDPTEEPNTSELPEAAEWFLNKMLGGFEQLREDAQDFAEDELEDITGLALPAPLQSLIDILERLENIADIGTQMREALIEVVEIVIANPTRPELFLIEVIEVIRNVTSEILSIGEDTALTFLDLVDLSINTLRDILNSAFYIPFISELLDLVGAGQVTLLNLTSTLVAIPSTVLSKLLFGEAPFKDVPQPDFATFTTKSNVTTFSAQTTSDETADNDGDNVNKTVKGLTIVALCADLLDGILSAMLDATPENADEVRTSTLSKFTQNRGSQMEIMSLLLSSTSWLAGLADIPSKKNHWEYVMWSWRTSVLALDIAYIAIPFAIAMSPETVAFLKDDKVEKYFVNQRLRRANRYTVAIATAFGVVDLGLTGRYFATLDDEENFSKIDRNLEISNETLGLIPTLFCWLRVIPTGQPYLAIGQSIMDVVVAGSTFSLGTTLVKREFD